MPPFEIFLTFAEITFPAVLLLPAIIGILPPGCKFAKTVSLNELATFANIEAGNMQIFLVNLHGFQKKSQKTPRRELKIAVKRMQAFIERQGGEF